MMTATECHELRIARHRERIQRLEERDALSLEISEDQAEWIEHEYHQDMERIGAVDRSYELFQVSTGLGL